MKVLSVLIMALALTGTQHTGCYAGCNCDDWMNKGGYCVDYIKARIPAFPVPQNIPEIESLKNRDISDVAEGDVAIFDLNNFWHVAYVEKVHLDRQGNATSIDVSEMNFGDQMSFNEYKRKWGQKSRSEWKRALCCGVTDNYDRTSSRKNIALNSVTQIWSPASPSPGDGFKDSDDTVLGKVREVFNRFIQFTGREL